MASCTNCFGGKNNKFLPILLGFISIASIMALFDTYARYSEHDSFTIMNTRTYKSLNSPPFHMTINVSIGVLIPLAIDHILTLYALWSPKIFLHIESYIIPILMCIMQVFNIYFTCAPLDYHYYWIYHGTLYVQTCILCNTAFVIQFHSVSKDSPPIITNMITSAMTFFNLSLILKLLTSMDDGIWYKIIWAAVLLVSTTCSCVVIYDWFSRYRLAVKTGLQNQSSIYSFWEMLLVTCFFLLIEVFDVITGENKLENSSQYRIVFYNVLITSFIYLFSEIYVLKNKALGMFSVEALETKRSFVRYVSHEIRTPLNAVTVGLQLLDKEIHKQCNQKANSTGKPSNSQKGLDSLIELIADTSQACSIAVEILSDLLLYEKIDGGLLVLDAQEVVLWPFIEEVLKMFTVQARGLELELIWQPLMDARVFTTIDRYKMSQVIRNLVSNALKFSKPGQKVIVGAEIVSAVALPSPSRHHRPKNSFNGSHSPSHSHSVSHPNTSRIVPDNEFPRECDIEQNRSTSEGARHYVYSDVHYPPRNSWKEWIVNGACDMWDYVVGGMDNDEPSMSGTISNAILKAASTAHSYATNKVDMVRITVTDGGVGISKENQKRLFNEIVQFNAAKNQEGKGSGIGLWISNKIMKLHGGRIGVESEGEGMGSTFYIDIPITRLEYVTNNRSVKSKVVLRDMLRSIIANDGSNVNNTNNNNGGYNNNDANLPLPGIITSLRRGSRDESARNSNRRGSGSSTGEELAHPFHRSSRQAIRDSISSAVSSNTAVDNFPMDHCVSSRAGHHNERIFDVDANLATDEEHCAHTEKLTTNHPQDHASYNIVEPPSKRTVTTSSSAMSMPIVSARSVVHNDVPRDNFPICEGQEHVTVSQKQSREPPKPATSSARSFIFKSLSNLRLIHESSNHSLEKEPSSLSAHHMLSVEGKRGSSSSISRESKPIKRALVVDDSLVNRKMLKKYCLTYFNQCDEAVNGVEAMKKVESNLSQYKSPQVSPMPTSNHDNTIKPFLPPRAFGYDVIILDYFMPEMNGLEVVQRLRQMHYTGKIVGLTGNTEEAMKEAFLSAGADMVLIKPLQGDDLDRIVQGL